MSDTSKKQNFLHGAMLLTIATAVVKVIGALYKLPLNMAIGAEGYSYFMTAYDIYALLLLISSAGLPVAASRMISEAHTLGHRGGDHITLAVEVAAVGGHQAAEQTAGTQAGNGDPGIGLVH